MLSIDLSLRSTGYCIWENNKLKKYGIIHTDKDETPFERAKYISDTLIKLITDNTCIDRVFIEAPAYAARGSMSYVLMGVHFHVVTNITNDLGKDVIQIPITTIKKQFTGNGRAKKDEIMKFIPEDVLTMFKKDYVVSRGLTDLCDAYALGWVQFNKLKECK